MDLAFHFYPFTELGCSWITWLLKWFSTIHVLWISSFATLVARPLKLAAAFFRKLLNIRNIFRVAFLSCSHIRLEMSALDPAGQVRISLSRGDSLLSALSCDNFDIILLFDWLVNSFFKLFWNLFDFHRFSTVFLPPFSAASIILARSQRKSKENFDFF